MRRSGAMLLGLLLAVGLAAGTWLDAGAEDAKPQLIGTGKCKVCHKQDKRGNQFAVWEESAHAKAYATLATDEAKAVAKELGIEDPQQADACLVCHVTASFLGKEVVAMDSYSPDEGVGCEACHGPGSEYKSMKIMKDSAMAKAAGLEMHESDHCLQCHNEKSPTYKEFVFEKRWAEIAHPIPEGEG